MWAFLTSPIVLDRIILTPSMSSTNYEVSLLNSLQPAVTASVLRSRITTQTIRPSHRPAVTAPPVQHNSHSLCHNPLNYYGWRMSVAQWTACLRRAAFRIHCAVTSSLLLIWEFDSATVSILCVFHNRNWVKGRKHQSSQSLWWKHGSCAQVYSPRKHEQSNLRANWKTKFTL